MTLNIVQIALTLDSDNEPHVSFIGPYSSHQAANHAMQMLYDTAMQAPDTDGDDSDPSHFWIETDTMHYDWYIPDEAANIHQALARLTDEIGI